jgi:hypothetical protein
MKEVHFMRCLRAVLILTALLLASSVLAEGERISGLVWGDGYWFAADDSGLENQNGFQIRRVYFTVDKKVDEKFSGRVRLEMAHPGPRSSSSIEPFVKDAYLAWQIHEDHQLVLGISPTPTHSTTEDYCRYRIVEKMPMDLEKMGSTRDLGVALKGKMDEDGMIKYHAMVGNGRGVSSESDKGKKAQLAVNLYPSEGLFVQAYVDWNDLPDLGSESRDVYTLRGFVGYEEENVRVGGLFAHQMRQNYSTGKTDDGDVDLELNVVSAFAIYKASEDMAVFGRIDRAFEANPGVSSSYFFPLDGSAAHTLLIAGLDWSPAKNVNIIPNVEVAVYDDPDAGEGTDLTLLPRVTFGYKF